MKPQFRSALRSLPLCLLLGVGCSTSATKGTKFSDHFHGSDAVVQIPFKGTFAEVRVSVYSFPANVHANSGIAALQTKEWDTAIEQFKLAVAESPKKGSYHLALAVAYEVRGNYPEAKEHYLEANRLKGGEGLFDAQAGLKRIEARGK